MEYQVPQFIEMEDKIFGPFTLKQFIYIAGGIGLCAILFLYIPLPFSLLLILPTAGFAGALAFYRLNGKPFIEIVEAGFNYFLTNRLYLWRKERYVAPTAAAPEAPKAPTQTLSRRKLEELAWSLDVKDTGNPDKL